MPLCPGAGNPIAGASPRSRARRLGGGRAVRAGRAGRRADVRRARVRDRGRRRLSRRRRVPRQRRAPASLRSVSAQRRPTGRGADRAQGRRLRRSHPVDGRRRQLGRRSQADVPTSRMRRDCGEPGLLRGRADPVALVAGATDRRAAAATAAAAATTTAAAPPPPPPPPPPPAPRLMLSVGLGPALALGLAPSRPGSAVSSSMAASGVFRSSWRSTPRCRRRNTRPTAPPSRSIGSPVVQRHAGTPACSPRVRQRRSVYSARAAPASMLRRARWACSRRRAAASAPPGISPATISRRRASTASSCCRPGRSR